MAKSSKTDLDTIHPRHLLRLLRRSWQSNPSLTVLGITMVPLLGGTFVGLVVDRRVITSEPVWLKPTKFALSVSIYAFTLAWFLRQVQGRPRLIKLVSIITTLTLLAEMGLIVLQAMRGTKSHFNVATPFDARLFTAMKALIVPPWLATLLAIILVLRQRTDNPAFVWSLRLALMLVFVGMAVGFLMVEQRSPLQQATLAAGHTPSTLGAHSVGVDDGGPGLPLVGWSTTGGDLRVPHFFGIHALQIMPLLGWLISKVAGRVGVGKRSQVALVWMAGLAYAGGLALLTRQALRGESIVAPDRTTRFALGTLVGCTVSGIATVGILGRKSTNILTVNKRK